MLKRTWFMSEKIVIFTLKNEFNKRAKKFNAIRTTKNHYKRYEEKSILKQFSMKTFFLELESEHMYNNNLA
jgi:hypothetical protein